MKLRKPRIEDYAFVHEAYQDWPLTDRGPVTLDTAVRWTRRWIHRSDEVCLIGEEDVPVGLITYRRGNNRVIDMRHAVVVDNLVVHPDHRGKGHANAIVKALRDMLVADGVTVAVFDAMTGPIASQVERGKFQKVGEADGQTGILVRGQLTADMRV